MTEIRRLIEENSNREIDLEDAFWVKYIKNAREYKWGITEDLKESLGEIQNFFEQIYVTKEAISKEIYSFEGIKGLYSGIDGINAELVEKSNTTEELAMIDVFGDVVVPVSDNEEMCNQLMTRCIE